MKREERKTKKTKRETRGQKRPSSGGLGSFFSSLWGVLGGLGRLLGHLGGVLGRLGHVLVRLEAVLGRHGSLEAVLGAFSRNKAGRAGSSKSLRAYACSGFRAF